MTSVILWTLKCPQQIRKTWENCKGESWRQESWVPEKHQVPQHRDLDDYEMCGQDIILVKLQIMFKANIYKEDWHEECAERVSSSVLQLETASKCGKKRNQGSSINIFE